VAIGEDEASIDQSKEMGKNHLTALKLGDELYVVDSDPGQLKIGKEFSIPPDHLPTNYRDFLDRVEGVDIVTPADKHLAIR
jgi:predicted dehydrogenase